MGRFSLQTSRNIESYVSVSRSKMKLSALKNFQKKKKKTIKRAMDKKRKEKKSQRALKQKVSDLTVCFSSFTNEVDISQRKQKSFKIKIYIILKMIRNRSEPYEFFSII